MLGALVLAAFTPLSGGEAKTLRVLYKFAGGSDGQTLEAPLVRDKAGNLYGTTLQGGAGDCYQGGGCGTVFKLAPDGTKTILYSFQGGSDGAGAEWLIRDKAGDFYGTTTAGGGTGCFDNYGCGTVFKLAPDGTETVLHAFSDGSDGADPGSLIMDKRGNLYGTAFEGGVQNCDEYGCGLIFRLAPDGTETVLYSFTGKTDGGRPVPGILLDDSGNLYGATSDGGLTGCSCGTVFKLDRHGTETVLHAFAGGTDGEFPYAGPVADSSGNLYGTTFSGGDENCGYGSGCGTVFKVAPDGTETVLYAFSDSGNNAGPMAPVILDKAGNLYGTTAGVTGGAAGTVFKLAPSGTETVLATFDGSDGGTPLSGLIADTKGHLYGTTEEGGSGCFNDVGCGVVFEIKE